MLLGHPFFYAYSGLVSAFVTDGVVRCKQEEGMKAITITWQSLFPFVDIPPVDGFSIRFSEDEKEAVLCSVRDDCDSSKLISKDCAVHFWNQVQHTVNFHRVLEENAVICGVDGSLLTVKLEEGMNSLSLTLWQPDKEDYRERGMEESYRLMELIEDLEKGR